MTDLRPDCARCHGLCCVALPFARGADFPEDKSGGTPCRHLAGDDRCTIHDRLRDLGWRGCTTFGCFGAGQRVSQADPRDQGWRDDPTVARREWTALPVVHQLHEMVWLLREAATYPVPPALARRCSLAADELWSVAGDAARDPSSVDVPARRGPVGELLREVSEHVRGRARHTPPRVGPHADLVGARLAGADLCDADLRGALLVAADLRGATLRRTDLLGADLRDADLRGAQLAGALLVTQPQLDSARGDATTSIPAGLERPRHWV